MRRDRGPRPGDREQHPHAAGPSGFQSVAIVGLGLIGGSLARDLAARGVRVLGYDRDPQHLQGAVDLGIVHTALDSTLAGVAEADVVVLAIPVSRAPAVLEIIAPHLAKARLITDVGSTKRSIVRAAEKLGVGERFVGSHPLAGDHCAGWEASRLGLFSNARVYLCPASETPVDTLDLAEELWLSVGASTEVLSAEAHDARLAWTSHLPQLASTALAQALASRGIAPSDLGPGGRGMTRLAGSSPEMWTAITLDNADHLTRALATLEDRLRELRNALGNADAPAIRHHFAEGQRWSAGDSGEK